MIYRFESREQTGGADNFPDRFRVSATVAAMPWRADGEPRHFASAMLRYDSLNLYVNMRAHEPALLATRERFGDPVCRDSCLEFFFAPLPVSNAYFNFEVNPRGTLYVGFSASGTRAGSRLLTELNDLAAAANLASPSELFAVSTHSGPDAWEVSYRIPYSFIRRYAPGFRDPVPGDVLRCNFYTCCDDAPVPYYSVWNNIVAPAPDYHLPEYFGTLVFE